LKRSDDYSENDPSSDGGSFSGIVEGSNDLEEAQSDPSRAELIGYSAQFSGPMPHPAMLAEYEKVQPGLADRIVAMAEKEQAHHHEMAKEIVLAQSKDLKMARREKTFGQICGLLIGTFTVGGGVFAAVNGAQIPGTFIGSSGVVGIVSVFVLDQRRKETNEDNEIIEV
jgi:uncharacterized membrane protein